MSAKPAEDRTPRTAVAILHLSSPSHSFPGRAANRIKETVLVELQKQRRIAFPLIPMNSAWFVKTAITTAFLGQLGELQLAAATVGFTFANVTGFSILTGLCWAMEPICGQAHGAKNHKLLHKTLLMTTTLLLLTSLPISFLWLYVDKVLLLLGQQKDIATVAKRYVVYLLPDLLATAFLSPLKTYLSSQGITLPIMLVSAVSLAFHVPFNIFLSKARGIEGVALATGLTDLSAAIMLALYVLATEKSRTLEGGSGGWWDQRLSDWSRLLRLAVQCCFAGCLEWWCYEILILLAGRTSDARRVVAVLTVVLNFDYLMYGFMISIATCASTRVANELGAGRFHAARHAACTSLALSAVSGLAGGLGMVAFRGEWGSLFSHEKGVVDGVRKVLPLMALVEVFNFPIGACGGIVRGTSRPGLGACTVGGFYLVGLPTAVAMAFGAGLGVSGLMLGFLVGGVTSLGLLGVLVARVNWVEEAEKAQKASALTSPEVW